MKRFAIAMFGLAAAAGCVETEGTLGTAAQEELVGPLPCGTLLRFSVDGDSGWGNAFGPGDLLDVARMATEFAVHVNVLEQVRALGCEPCPEGKEGCEPYVAVDHPDSDFAGAFLSDLRRGCRWNGFNWQCFGTVDFNVASGRVPTLMAGCTDCVDCPDRLEPEPKEPPRRAPETPCPGIEGETCPWAGTPDE